MIARQVIGVNAAVREAGAAGLNWLLHIDVDELWYHPGEPDGAPQDAVSFFSNIHPGIDQLTFLNWEAAV